MSGDVNMQAAFKQGLDIHAATASKVFNVDIGTVTRDQRSRAKAVNFGIAYGQGAFGLSQNLNIPRAEAKQIIDDYFAQFLGSVRIWIEHIAFCMEHGYVKTMLGRPPLFAGYTSGNNRSVCSGKGAINAPMQGTAADIIKIAWSGSMIVYRKNS